MRASIASCSRTGRACSRARGNKNINNILPPTRGLSPWPFLARFLFCFVLLYVLLYFLFTIFFPSEVELPNSKLRWCLMFLWLHTRQAGSPPRSSAEETKLEILEDIWSRQAHPDAADAARGPRRLRLEGLASSEVTVSPEAHTSGESGGTERVSSESNGGCGGGGGGGFHRERDGNMGDSSGGGGFGIPGRLSVFSPEAHTSAESRGISGVSSLANGGCGRGGGGGFYRERNTSGSSSSSGSSSGFGIPGRWSARSSLESFIQECRESRFRGGNGTVLSIVPSSSDASVVKAGASRPERRRSLRPRLQNGLPSAALGTITMSRASSRCAR